MLDHRGLHRMQAVVGGDALHSDDLLAQQQPQRRDARVHRTPTIVGCEDHGTSSAIPFGATLLGPREASQAQPMGQRGGVEIEAGNVDGDGDAVHNKVGKSHGA